MNFLVIFRARSSANSIVGQTAGSGSHFPLIHIREPRAEYAFDMRYTQSACLRATGVRQVTAMTLIHTISPLFRCSACAIRPHSICGAMSGPEELAELASARLAYRSYMPNDPVYAQGDPVGNVFILVSGWVHLFQILEDGRRQIQRFLMPGDLFGAVSLGHHDIDHGAEALTRVTACIVPNAKLAGLQQRHPAFANRVLEAVEQSAHASMDTVTNLGRRNATERVARLLYGCLSEMRRRDLIAPDASGASLPLTQVTISDALGLTSIHVNRVLRSLREMNVLTFVRGALIVLDDAKLARLVHCAGGYDHRRAPPGIDVPAMIAIPAVAAGQAGLR
ncbi:Crp/Fnr family transcriptional regulator [Ferrovibrio xuzhouensis]|uniref:Crp/Fnr family transcriptional regulator n=1 Tax=Ferrovibrio xuzhouensis TaxID=1576914 RepID=A0ABV7VBX1_9PROT